ncbi:MAG: hypothetical protein WCP98_12585 [Actinomycetes bacterium]
MGDGQLTRRHARGATPALAGFAGFDDIRMLGDYTGDAATVAGGILVPGATTA